MKWQKIVCNPEEVRRRVAPQRVVLQRLALSNYAYAHDVTAQVRVRLSDDEDQNERALEQAVSQMIMPLPFRHPTRPAMPVFIFHRHNTTIRARECGYAAGGVTTFSVNSLPREPPEQVPASPAMAHTSDSAREAVAVETFRLPLPRATFSIFQRAQPYSVQRLVAVANIIVGLLPGPDDEDVVLPDPDVWALFGEPRPADAEWDAALLMLTASACRSPGLVRDYAKGFERLIRTGAAADPTFMARMRAANPAYSACMTPDYAAMQATLFMERNAEHMRVNFYDYPAAIRCFGLLLAHDESEKTDN